MPFVHPEVGIEAVGDGVPGDMLPTHPRFQARDVGLRRARGIDQRGVARIQVREIGDLVGPERATDAGMLRPAMHAGLEEGAVDDQLMTAPEQIEQTRFALGPVERVGLVHGHPRHAPPLGGQRVTRAGHGLFLDEKLLARGVPLLRRYDRWRVHGVTPVLPVASPLSALHRLQMGLGSTPLSAACSKHPAPRRWRRRGGQRLSSPCPCS